VAQAAPVQEEEPPEGLPPRGESTGSLSKRCVSFAAPAEQRAVDYDIANQGVQEDDDDSDRVSLDESDESEEDSDSSDGEDAVSHVATAKTEVWDGGGIDHGVSTTREGLRAHLAQRLQQSEAPPPPAAAEEAEVWDDDDEVF